MSLGSAFCISPIKTLRPNAGKLRRNCVEKTSRNTSFQYINQYANEKGSRDFKQESRLEVVGREMTKDGLRWSIVTIPAFSASDGTTVIAVAPDPMTMTRLPE